MPKTQDKSVEDEAFLMQICGGGERIFILKQEGVISEIRGKAEFSCKEDWITLKMPGCRCHLHIARSRLAKASFVSQTKAEGQVSRSVELRDEGGRALLKVYFPAASDNSQAVEYDRLKELYGEEIVLSRGEVHAG